MTRSLSISFLTATVLFGACLQGQTRTPSVPGRSREDSKLSGLITAQQNALQSGDASAIETATRPLAAELLREIAQVRLVQGKATEAVELEQRSLALEDVPVVRLELASMLLRTGRPKEAQDESGKVIAQDPRNAVALTIQGSALRATGDDQGAVASFNHALKLQPSVSVAYALASSLLAIHEKAKAEIVFRQILEASGDTAIQHVAAGDAYLEARYLAEAVGEFQKALAMDSSVQHAEFFLGFTYLQMNEWGPNSQSFEHLRAAVRQAPRDYLSNFYLGAIESTDGTDIPSSNRHLQVAAEADPQSPEAWLYLGLNAVREKDTTKAKTYLRKAIEVTGTDEARNNYQIRRVYAVLGRILVSEGNHAEGDVLLAKYRASEHSAIGNSSAVIARAAGQDDSRAALGGIPAAKFSFPGMNTNAVGSPETGAADQTPVGRQAVMRTPEQARQIAGVEKELSSLLSSTFNDLGTAEARQGKYDVALAHFQQAEHWQTPSSSLLRNLGLAAFRVGNFVESARALSAFFEAEAKNSAATGDERARMMLAMSLFSTGKFVEADESFARSESLTLQDPRAAYSWAYSLAHSGQQQRANEIAANLTEQPLQSDVLSLVCHIYMDTENYEQGLACYRKAYRADPYLKMAHYQAGESLIRLDRPAEAVAELKQELLLSPASSEVQSSLAFALLQNSQRAEATTLLRSVTAADPAQAQAQYQLGKVLLEDGKTGEAIEHLEAAARSDPRPDYIHYQLQAAYRKAGRSEDAEKELKVYRDMKARNRNATTVRPKGGTEVGGGATSPRQLEP